MSFHVNVIGNQGSFAHFYKEDVFSIANQKLYGQHWNDFDKTLIDVGRDDYDKIIEAIYKSEKNGFRTTYCIPRVEPEKVKPKKADITVLNNEEFQEIYPEYRELRWWKANFWIWRKNIKNTCFIQIGEEFEMAYRRGVKNGLGKRKVGIERKYKKFVIISETNETEAKEILNSFLLGESSGKYLWK